MKIYTDTPWLKTPYTKAETQQMLGILASLITHNEKTAIETLERMSDIVFNHKMSFKSIKPLPIAETLATFNQYKTHDFLMLAIIVCFAETDHHVDRTQLLLDNWTQAFHVDKRIKSILEAVVKDDRRYVCRQDILGEAYQNQAARENGINQLGWAEYKKQMKSMTKGVEHPKLKEKFAFMNDLPANTMGGQLTKALRDSKLTLPGEKFGFAEFFLWHDLSHLLSGNKMDYPGEMGANIFTAAYSRRGKFKIMLFGLLEWNLGYKLAIVAKASTNQFSKPGVIDIYLKSLVSGCNTIFDLLEWPLDVMVDDLKMDIDDVRRKYNIVSIR